METKEETFVDLQMPLIEELAARPETVHLTVPAPLPAPSKSTYRQSHPWLTFEADLRDAPYQLWMLLGEARSKIEHIAGVPLRPGTAEVLHKLYLAKGARATTAIEGNTLTEQQVLDHLDGRLDLPPSQRYLTKEIDNIVEACNEIIPALLTGHTQASSELIRTFNRTVLQDLPVEEGVVPGEYRTHAVRVARYLGAPPGDCEYLVDRLCQWLNDGFDPPREDLNLSFAILKAILAHLYLAWIHPFGDGNGRTARLLEVQILVAAGVPTPAAHLLSNHYNHTRSEYYRQLDLSSKKDGDVGPFLVYAVEGFVDGLRAQLEHIRQQQWDVAWTNHVHEAFRGKKGPTADRQRAVALAVSSRQGPLTRDQIKILTPDLATAYARKTEKTLSRDLNALEQMNLLLLGQAGYVANRELILTFLPFRNPSVALKKKRA